LLKEIIWLGDSRSVVSDFPIAIKEDMGFELYRLQKGETPLKSRPMKSIGRAVYEIKEQDHKGWYRIIYAIHIREKIYVLHCFRKKSSKTAKVDIDIAKMRIKSI
jgi:phage-related protein